MKLCLFLVAGAALASAPPRIELDLQGQAALPVSVSYDHQDNANPYARLNQTDGTPVGARKDWSQICIVNQDPADCPMPVAKAYDHVDKDISSSIREHIYLINVDGEPCTRESHPYDELSNWETVSGESRPRCSTRCSGTHCEVSSVVFDMRATYLIKYDVTDNAGNHAEQVVFALTIGDSCGTTQYDTAGASQEQCDPELTLCTNDAEWQAAGDKDLCTTSIADDNADSDAVMQQRLYYKIEKGTDGGSRTALCDMNGDDHTTVGGASWWSYAYYKSNKATYDVGSSDTGYREYPVGSGTQIWPFNKCQKPGLLTSAEQAACPCALSALDTSSTGTYFVTYMTCDRAGSYGSGSDSAETFGDNCVSQEQQVVIKDTLAPMIFIQGGNPEAQQCHRLCQPDQLSSTDPDLWPRLSSSSPDPLCFDDRTGNSLGTEVKDILDTLALGKTITAATTWARNLPDSSTVGNYTITYNAVDDATLAATTKYRTVMVQDTVPPTAKLVGQSVVTIVSTEEEATDFDSATPARDDGITCHDDCSAGYTSDMNNALEVTGADTSTGLTWPIWKDGKTWNEMLVGRYTRVYMCRDGVGNEHTIERHFDLVDEAVPVIDVKGNNPLEVKANVTEEYEDPGATCHDIIDGDLSHAVEVSGAVVNRRVPGTYVINYDCMDISNNNATTRKRTVTVVDDECPEIEMLGNAIMYVEAGYTWVDPGATAYDKLDGDITDHIVTDGDTVNDAKAFYSRRSCREIKETYAEASSGLYYISREVTTDGNTGWQRVLVHCDMESNSNQGVTFFPCDGCKAVQPYSTAQGDCSSYGMDMVQWSWDGYQQAAADPNSVLNADAPGLKGYLYYYIPAASLHSSQSADTRYTANGYTDMYLCGVNDAAGDYAAHTNNEQIETAFGADHEKITHAESGKYVIAYKVSDSSNNPQCSSPLRTVLVRDTLPPVLTLHIKQDATTSKMIQTSRFNHYGIAADGQYTYDATPARDRPNEPREPQDETQSAALTPAIGDYTAVSGHPSNYFMAQSASSVNVWFVGAVASAVAGVALLALGSRKAAKVSVPV